MKRNQLSKLMFACGYEDYGMDKLTALEMILNRDSSFSLEKAKIELIEALQLKDFDWVNLAINSKFVYTSNEVSPTDFSVDNLLIFTDSFRWKDIVQSDAVLTINQKDELKEQFREIGVQYFRDICELMRHNDFDWLPFEVKHAYMSNFKEIEYVNEDIVYYLKKILWDYLFPNSFSSDRLNSIKENSLQLLQVQKINQGWTEISQVLESLEACFPEIDLYELNRVDWGKNIQSKMHYRNPFTLGFKRITPES